jgi:hypothetical protein
MTETSMSKSVTLFRHSEEKPVHLSLLAAVDLKQGQEVYLSANMTVSLRNAGSQFPIGIVTVGGKAGDLVTVGSCIQRSVLAHAKGGTINFNTFVKPNGTFNADGTPEYVAAAVALGDFVSAIVLSGGAVDTLIQLGFLRTPMPLGAVS